jgi:hypothetical protein
VRCYGSRVVVDHLRLAIIRLRAFCGRFLSAPQRLLCTQNQDFDSRVDGSGRAGREPL